MLVKAIRFAAGLALGLSIWWYGTPAYNALLARAAQPLLRIDGELQNAYIGTDGRAITVSGPDLRPLRIPADQLTYNAILLLALFATLPLRRRVAIAFAISIGILLITHVLAVVVAIQATYARADGVANVWTSAEYMYRLVGMFALAFACWLPVSLNVTQPTRPAGPRFHNHL